MVFLRSTGGGSPGFGEFPPWSGLWQRPERTRFRFRCSHPSPRFVFRPQPFFFAAADSQIPPSSP